jgi:hypothetical protein
MRSTRYIPLLIAGAGVAMLQFPSAGQAAVFTLTSGSSSNTTVKTFIDSGMTLTIDGANSTGDTPGTLNTSSAGLCAWTLVNSSAGRCGYGTTPGTGITAFKLSFDKAIAFNSFDVSVFETASISQGTIGFSLDGTNFTNFTFNGTGTIPVAFQALTPNQPIYVQTSATLQSGSDTGIFRLGSMDVREVPGPLPLLSVGAALGMTQKCRRLSARIHRSAALTSH